MNNREFIEVFKRNIKVALQEKGLTNESIAKELNISSHSVEETTKHPHTKNGMKFDFDLLVEICDRYGIDFIDVVPQDKPETRTFNDREFDARIVSRRLRYELYKLQNIENFLIEHDINKNSIYRVVGLKAKRGLCANTLFDICKALNVSADYIIGLTDK